MKLHKKKKTKKADKRELLATMQAQKSGTILDEFNKRRGDLPLDVGFVAQVPFIVG